MAEFYSQKRKIHANKSDPSFIKDAEALKVFPQAKGYVKKRKKEIATEIRNYILLGNKIQDICLKIKDLNERKPIEELFMELKVNFPIKDLEIELKRLNKMTDGEYIKDNLDKVKAKNRPISDFIEFNKAGFAKCIFHQERTGSLKYYPKDNHVYCFSCNKSADVIEVVMQLNKCTFVKALKILCNG